MESDPRSGSPRLLVLGAGPAQLGLLEAAQARGVWTAVVDRDPGAPGCRLADRRCILSTEDEPAIERLVGWKARTSFEEGLERTVAWYRENEAWWRAILAREARAYSS